MDKERQINKIAHLIDDNASPEAKADRLFDAGLRFEKEVAKKVMQDIYQSLAPLLTNPLLMLSAQAKLKSLYRKYIEEE